MGPCPHLWICACKVARLPPELKVCMGYPDLTCGFVRAKQRAYIRN